jgi:hypothetical protein
VLERVGEYVNSGDIELAMQHQGERVVDPVDLDCGDVLAYQTSSSNHGRAGSPRARHGCSLLSAERITISGRARCKIINERVS